eukprot:4878544-Ditylum_brightwellii.AAC.1
MVPVAHFPVMAVGDTAVEARGKTTMIYTAIVVINTSICDCQDPHSRIFFHSLAEEREWAEEWQHKCRSHKSLFDTEPALEQLARAEANETHVAGASASSYVPNGEDGHSRSFIVIKYSIS